MAKPVLPLNPLVQNLVEASSISINELVYKLKREGRDIITLSLGEAYFEVPQMNFDAAAFQKNCHYAESRGDPQLRGRIVDYYASQYRAVVDPEREIIISAGSKVLIYMAILSTVSVGDEVLIQEPAWLSYPHHVRLAGGVPKFLSYTCGIDEFEQFFTHKTRMVIICNPNNPAGRVYTADELKRLYELCRSRGVYLLVDEAYSDFVLDGEFTSITHIVPEKDGMIAINSLSKNLGISGWRIGYCISSSHLVSQLLKLNQHLITCAPTILMAYCAEHFGALIESTRPQAISVVEKRRRVQGMASTMGLRCLPGSATFYLFISIENYPTSSKEFAERLLIDRGIAVVPGSAYGESTERFVRVSIGTESEERISCALKGIYEEIHYNRVPGVPMANF